MTRPKKYSKMLRGLLCTVVLSFFGLSCFSQTYADSVATQFKFIKAQKNRIENDSIGLGDFYEKLYQLEDKTTKRVNVVHIGDSHIQADLFSGMLRQKLHQRFGNAGRGLIFPHKVAKTTEPYNYKTSSNVSWEAKRSISLNNPLPIGIGGVTIRTKDSSAWLKINVLDQGGLDYGFNKLSIFQDKGPAVFDFMVYEEDNIIGFINSNLMMGGNFLSTVYFDAPRKNITLKAYKRDSTQKYMQIYGLLLENNQPGVLYSSSGVNGAECRHCNAALHFFDQLSALYPDLVIISMGTNEAFPRGFNKELFNSQIDSLVSNVRKENPQANILFTTPADSYRRKKYKNPDMLQARNTIVSYCRQKGLAYWDLYEVMGGMGSMAKWRLKALAAADKVHFSPAGYELQGKLLFSAIQNGYNDFKKYRHP